MDINSELVENSNFLRELIEDVIALGKNPRHSKAEDIKNKQAVEMIIKISKGHSRIKPRFNSLLD